MWSEARLKREFYRLLERYNIEEDGDKPFGDLTLEDIAIGNTISNFVAWQNEFSDSAPPVVGDDEDPYIPIWDYNNRWVVYHKIRHNEDWEYEDEGEEPPDIFRVMRIERPYVHYITLRASGRNATITHIKANKKQFKTPAGWTLKSDVESWWGAIPKRSSGFETFMNWNNKESVLPKPESPKKEEPKRPSWGYYGYDPKSWGYYDYGWDK